MMPTRQVTSLPATNDASSSRPLRSASSPVASPVARIGALTWMNDSMKVSSNSVVCASAPLTSAATARLAVSPEPSRWHAPPPPHTIEPARTARPTSVGAAASTRPSVSRKRSLLYCTTSSGICSKRSARKRSARTSLRVAIGTSPPDFLPPTLARPAAPKPHSGDVSFDVHVRVLHDLGPGRNLGAEDGRELLRRVGDRCGALLGERLHDLRLLQGVHR